MSLPHLKKESVVAVVASLPRRSRTRAGQPPDLNKQAVENNRLYKNTSGAAIIGTQRAGGSSSPLLDVRINLPAAHTYHRAMERAIHLEAHKRPIHNTPMLYRGFPAKLHHRVPHWIEPGSLFHIRIALDREKEQTPLIAPPLGKALLDSARFYEAKQHWHISLFLLMPDHLHALLSFQRDKSMSRIIGDWKHFQTHEHGIMWQPGYFDHRLRADERGGQLSAKMNYIRQNPVAAGLCTKAENWPWRIEQVD